MDILSNVAMSYFPSGTTLTFDLGGHETAALPLDCQFESEEGFAAIVLEIALAYHRLIDSELVRLSVFCSFLAWVSHLSHRIILSDLWHHGALCYRGRSSS